MRRAFLAFLSVTTRAPGLRAMPAWYRDAGVPALGLVAALLQAPAVMACSPAPHTPAVDPIIGDACAVHYLTNEYDRVGLAAAEDMGDGLVRQTGFEGNACYWSVRVLVSDCAAGRSVLIGPERMALMDGPKETAFDLFDVRVAALSQPRTLEAVTGAAGALTTGDLAPDVPAAFGEKEFTAGCGCRLYYPDLIPG